MAKRYGIQTNIVASPSVQEAIIRFKDAGGTAEALEGAFKGMAENVVTRAKANAMAVDSNLAGAIEYRIIQRGKEIEAEVYVNASTNGPNGEPMAVFTEMGTGPQGAASNSGPAGKKYPLPDSAYTLEPWYFYDKTGKKTKSGKPGFVKSTGQPANPYLYPAFEADRPFWATIVQDAIKRALVGKKEGE
jgi:hypothetical protein